MHRGDHVVIDAPSFVDRLSCVFCLLVGQVADHTVDRYQTVGKQEAIRRNERLPERFDQRCKGDAMFEALGMKRNLDVKRLRSFVSLNDNVGVAISIFLSR